MAVGIAMPQEREGGFDKFLRRLGGVANIANAGISAYGGVQDIMAKPQKLENEKNRLDSEAKLRNLNIQEAEAKLNDLPEKMAQDSIKRKLDQQKLLADIQKTTYDLGSEKTKFDRLPIENQEIIRDTSKKLVGRTAAISKIDATLDQLNDPKISSDQKVVIGNQLLKTLNDPDASDALANAEAERLAPFLEFQKGNFTGPGAFIGRDINGFIKQLELSRDRYKNSVKSGTDTIAGLKEGRGLSDLIPKEAPKKTKNSGSGLTDAEKEELKMLEKKYGGSNGR